MHWFIPHEQTVIDKLADAIKPGGYLYLSCAFDFDYVLRERAIQEQVLMDIRRQYPVLPTRWYSMTFVSTEAP